MNTSRRKALLVVVCLSLLLGGWFWSIREEIAEAYEVANCGASCFTLAPEQLRLEVIKAYLHLKLDTIIELNDGSRN